VAIKRVSPLGKYLSAVREIRRRWRLPNNEELWFRAEDSAHKETHLQPGLYRPKVSAARQPSIAKLLELENDLYEEFGRCATQLSDARAQSDDWEWDSYFLMQHHGVPTRLLDWTDGALIALHFAVAKKTLPAKTGAKVFVLDPYWLIELLEEHADRADMIRRWKEFSKKYPHDTSEDEWDRLYLPSDEEDDEEPLLATPVIPILWDSPHVTRRVAAQRSRFMIFGTDPAWLANLKKMKGSRIAELRISAASVKSIQYELVDAGVTESVVFPDLDGLGRELKQRWNARR
jgi:FRG domain